MMRRLLVSELVTAAALALVATSGADAAQRVSVPGPGRNAQPMPGGWHASSNVHRPRWGGRMQGRWWGGWRAPGGWGAYRRPVRGWVLPGYWIAPTWYISDWSGYGLPTPPAGYNWSRYYDDAVLIDQRGQVYDTIGGVDWDRYDAPDTDYTYRDDAPGYADDRGAPYAPPPRRDSGLGGAAIGAAVGGVAGGAIAGRNNRLGGALVGAGVGAVTGYAIDKAEDRGPRVPPPPGRRGAGYPPPPGPEYGAGYPPPPPPPIGRNSDYPPRHAYPAPPPPIVTTNNGATVTTVTTSGGEPGYYSRGYYYPGPTVTTVTVQTAPAVTTTTTDVWEDNVTYTKRPVRRVWRKRHWSPRCACK